MRIISRIHRVVTHSRWRLLVLDSFYHPWKPSPKGYQEWKKQKSRTCRHLTLPPTSLSLSHLTWESRMWLREGEWFLGRFHWLVVLKTRYRRNQSMASQGIPTFRNVFVEEVTMDRLLFWFLFDPSLTSSKTFPKVGTPSSHLVRLLTGCLSWPVESYFKRWL